MSDEAARRIEKAFTTGGAYGGDDPVTVARAYLFSSGRIEELEAALRELIEAHDVFTAQQRDYHRLFLAKKAALAALKGE